MIPTTRSELAITAAAGFFGGVLFIAVPACASHPQRDLSATLTTVTVVGLATAVSMIAVRIFSGLGRENSSMKEITGIAWDLFCLSSG